MYASIIKFITILEMLSYERYDLVLWICGDSVLFVVKEVVSIQLAGDFGSLNEQ